MIKNILLNDIKISDNFTSKTPGKRKFKNKRNQIKKGIVDTIVVDKDNLLLDGYITYLILKEQGVKSVEVNVNKGEKAKSYRVKEGITKQELLDLEFKDGSWQSEYEDVACVSKNIRLIEGIELNLVIKTDPVAFDDFEDVLILDSAFGQPYTPFYGDNYKQVIDSYGYLQTIVSRYNQAMDTEGIFEAYEN